VDAIAWGLTTCGVLAAAAAGAWALRAQGRLRRRLRRQMLARLRPRMRARLRARAALRARLSRAEREAGEARARAAQLIDASHDLICTYTADGLIAAVNDASALLRGHDSTTLSGRHLRELFDARFLPLLLPEASVAERVERFEALARTSNGGSLWLDITRRGLREGGRIAGFELAARDVTARRQAEEVRAATPDIVRALADAGSLDVPLEELLVTLAGALGWEYAELWWADERYDVLRCESTWYGDPPLAAFAQRSAVRTFTRGVGLAGRVWALGEPLHVVDLRASSDPGLAALARSDGFLQALAFPVRSWGRLAGSVVLLSSGRNGKAPPGATLRSVGMQLGQFVERRRADVALRRSEARNRVVLESALDCVIAMDHQGRVLEFNPAAVETFGWTRAEALGRPLADLIIPTELREAHQEGLARCLSGKSGRLLGQRVELEGMRKDGSRLPVEIAVAAIHVEDPPVFTAYIRDITERHAMERLKDELVSTVSHELRTPLASLRGFVELLLTREYPREEQHKFLRILDCEILRLTQLISDFLDVQRLEAGIGRCKLEVQDVRPVLRSTLEVASGGGSAHEFEVDLPETPLFASIDGERLRQALINLLGNAVKFSPDGGTVVLRAAAENGSVVIAVRDTGIGMSPETLDKLFSKFFRADDAATRQIQGTGLGLALVKEIVNEHGGKVRVESEHGKGSTFFIELPHVDAQEGDFERRSGPVRAVRTAAAELAP
jgi:PAS domain S-box-containing protein